MSPQDTIIAPDIEHLITEDDTPVDNMPSEKHQRLLTEPLYSNWARHAPGRDFLAAANVGIFPVPVNPAIVPDVFVSLDVRPRRDWWRKAHRSYMLWEFGKPPEVVIEIVSDTVGGEDSRKKQRYAQMGVKYYVIYDPMLHIMSEELTIYRLQGSIYIRQQSPLFPELNLGVTLWHGTFEDCEDQWLRWTDGAGGLIPTGKESTLQSWQRAEQEQQRAEQEQQRAERSEQLLAVAQQQQEAERQRAERLAALLRQAGIDPEQK